MIIWKKYINELIILGALLFMIIGYLYKNTQVNKLYTVKSETSKSINDINQIVGLKNQWDNKKIKSKILKIKNNLSNNNIKSFDLKSRKLTAILKDLSSKQMNKIIISLENRAVQIILIKVTLKNNKYGMEIKCKW
ncbi:hypothetical protein MNB_SV-9-1537 [hydrothermal vent metagenome]|uniref:Uncharacterized protein n=1 Tax=hydrothermal vent metagenome TaxID=652676 RepID=A0A1W1BGB8_9ZZZZ